MSEQEYYIGQIFEDMYPKEAADWCNANNTRIIEIDPITKDVEEEYQSMEEVVVPEQEVDGEIVPEHTESQLVTKTRTVEKTLRRFEIQAIPEPTVDQKKKNIRSVRDSYISGIEWRVSRYRDQVDAGIQTTDTEEEYQSILAYMQYLRDYPESSETWYEEKPMTFEEWQTSQD